jgi:hypothetical protein
VSIRKNAKFLTAAEREAFAKACVLMKAEVVNPTAAASDQYSRWDEYVAIHWMIQLAFAPTTPSVNFGHGGSGSYSFLSWHRYFLFQFEAELQKHVPGVTLPYWDWTDPAPIMTDDFLGPNGTVNSEVRSGYFAASAPGTPGNPTPAPPWWPAGLTGWILPSAFGGGAGALRRGIAPVSALPSAADLRTTLGQTTYPSFQLTLESGAGLASGNQMHNGMHGWVGGQNGQMSKPAWSPFDPFFYLHHCNIDRLWAMWQMDGHADEYPATGGKPEHRRADIMYPWTGGAAGYGTNAGISNTIPMPDFSAVGAKHNVDTLDFRAAFGYTYDTLAVIGIGLDRTGSMGALTPDPMVTSAPDVTKWEAARRGVSAFLQDCETVQQSGVTYVTAGVKTFRELGANDFAPVFPAPGYGLVKPGSAFSRAAFDSAVAGMAPGGGTPLADALVDVHDTLVDPPFGRVPADERRYLAMLTDGLLTAGSPMSSIADHSFGQTAVFAMGFGTGADVDYATLASMVAKGLTLPTTQVFHGENAGTIDKFYSNALARAIGFTTVFDPVLELFGGEHAHVDFQGTSADDAFLITVQGMDFDDSNWTFHLHCPDGHMAYGDDMQMDMHGSDHDHSCHADVSATREGGRLTLMVQRDNADDGCWVGQWRLMVAYRARLFDAMVMPTIGELIWPVTAGPARGARFARLLTAPKARVPSRLVRAKPANRLDVVGLSTNNDTEPACNAVVNIYARTRLQMELSAQPEGIELGKRLTLAVDPTVLQGNVTLARSFARLVAPANDLRAALSAMPAKDRPKEARLEGSKALKFDPARLLAGLERRDRKLARVRDEELELVTEESGRLEAWVDDTEVAGPYHLGVYLEGYYCPEHDHPAEEEHAHQGVPVHRHHDEDHDHATGSVCGPECALQAVTRVLTTSVAIEAPRRRRSSRRR